MENLTEEGGLRDFFASCFSKSENRPSAKALLSHRFLQFDTNPSDHTSLEKKLTMMDSNNHSVRLTTDDINDAALSIIKLRAKKSLSLSAHSSTILSKMLKISNLQASNLAKKLGVFPATVELAFEEGEKIYEEKLAAFEISPSEVLSRKGHGRRRTFVGESGVCNVRQSNSPKSVRPLGDRENNSNANFMRNHAKSEPPKLQNQTNGLDVLKEIKDFNEKIAKELEVEGGEGEGEGEGRRKSNIKRKPRRRSFTGIRGIKKLVGRGVEPEPEPEPEPQTIRNSSSDMKMVVVEKETTVHRYRSESML